MKQSRACAIQIIFEVCPDGLYRQSIDEDEDDKSNFRFKFSRVLLYLQNSLESLHFIISSVKHSEVVRQSWNPTWGTAAKLLLPFQLLYEFFIVISIEMMMNILGIIIYIYIDTLLLYYATLLITIVFSSHFKYLLYLLFFFPLFFFTMLVIFWMGLHPALWPWPGPGEAAGH